MSVKPYKFCADPPPVGPNTIVLGIDSSELPLAEVVATGERGVIVSLNAFEAQWGAHVARSKARAANPTLGEEALNDVTVFFTLTIDAADEEAGIIQYVLQCRLGQCVENGRGGFTRLEVWKRNNTQHARTRQRGGRYTSGQEWADRTLDRVALHVVEEMSTQHEAPVEGGLPNGTVQGAIHALTHAAEIISTLKKKKRPREYQTVE